jgi:hypothetical protein
MPTERMVEWFTAEGIETGLSTTAFNAALIQSANVFTA